MFLQGVVGMAVSASAEKNTSLRAVPMVVTVVMAVVFICAAMKILIPWLIIDISLSIARKMVSQAKGEIVLDRKAKTCFWMCQ